MGNSQSVENQSIMYVLLLEDDKYYIGRDNVSTDNGNFSFKIPDNLWLSTHPFKKLLYAKTLIDENDINAEYSNLVRLYGEGSVRMEDDQLLINDPIVDYQLLVDEPIVDKPTTQKKEQCIRCKYFGHNIKDCDYVSNTNKEFLCPGTTINGTKCRWIVAKPGYRCKYHLW
jgi:hypothetical protein